MSLAWGGGREYVSAKTLKELVSEYTGKLPTDVAFLLALGFMDVKTQPSNLKPKNRLKMFGDLMIKFPPLYRLREFADEWRTHQADVEQEIQRELQKKKFN
jgi:hypothetical protein